MIMVPVDSCRRAASKALVFKVPDIIIIEGGFIKSSDFGNLMQNLILFIMSQRSAPVCNGHCEHLRQGVLSFIGINLIPKSVITAVM